MKISKRVLALLLTVVVLSTLFLGCEKRENLPEDSSAADQQPSKTETIIDEEKTISSIVPSLTAQVQERFEENNDTVGWLQVPLTGVDDVVVFSDKDNEYYKRLNFNKNYEFDGVYYADYRSPFGEEFDGTAASLPVNTVIYGHAMTDNPESENYRIKMGPLHDLRDPDFATDVPYMFYSTGTEDFVYEIFALMVVNADNADVPYNNPKLEQAEYFKLMKEEVLPRSVLTYDVELKETDKFLTLSTCIYHLPNDEETELPYPNYYRYAVIGRLVTDLEKPLKESVQVELNKDILLDPNGPMASAK